MKSKILILLLLQTAWLFAQQSRFLEGETLYVWALNGLNMRKLPDAKSEKIAALPYGEKVIAQSNIGLIVAHEVKEFKDFKVNGVWLLVKYGDKEGFVFDGYLSRLVAPKKGDEFGYSAMDKYLEAHDEKIGKVTDFNEEHCGLCTQKYKSGIVKKGHFGDGIPQNEYCIPNITQYEGFIFLKFFYNADFKISKFKFDKKENKYILQEEDKDSGGGRYFHLKKQGNKIIILGTSYC